MRQKEAAEAERKACSRTVEKLQKAIDRFTEAEKGFFVKIVRVFIKTVSRIAYSPPGKSRKRDHCAEVSGRRSGRSLDLLGATRTRTALAS
jgi:hypothetical protein